VATQITGDFCVLKTGDIGVCQPLTQCTTAVYQALNGDMPIVCSIKENMHIVCCVRSPTVRLQPETHQNIIQKQTPPRFTSQYYLFDAGTHEIPTADFPVRHSREDGNKPWWLIEKPFTVTTSAPLQKPQSSNNNNGNTNHHQGISRPGNLQNQQWYSERPFSSAGPPPLPPSPPPNKPTPKTITESVNSQNRRNGHTTVSEIKCNEYSKLATSQIAALPLVPTSEPVHVDIPKCDFGGVPIIGVGGGEESRLKEFPHMVALGYLENGETEWNCGGSLISEYFVLTAAHCASRRNHPTIARLGDFNLKVSSDGARPVNYSVVDIFRHPDYKPPAKYNDIALLKLDRRVEFNEFIRPACLYTSNTFDVNKTVATGWGKTDFAEKKSDTLLKVVLSIIDNNLCNELYNSGEGTRELRNGIVPSMMCAGELEGGKDTCQGDSGGPIQNTRPDNRCTYSIIGITSFGKFCAAKNAPGVYTRVSSFVPWIESIVWPDE